jgi:hypothetical protein
MAAFVPRVSPLIWRDFVAPLSDPSAAPRGAVSGRADTLAVCGYPSTRRTMGRLSLRRATSWNPAAR